MNFRTVDASEVIVDAAKYLHDYWSTTRADKSMPAWRTDFRIDDLGWGLVGSLIVVDVIDGGRDFRYRFWGTRSVVCKGFEVSGKLMSELPIRRAYRIGIKQYNDVIAVRRPLAMIYEVPKDVQHFGVPITYRFPLSSGGESVDHIVSYQDMEVNPKKWELLFDKLWAGKRPDT